MIPATTSTAPKTARRAGPDLGSACLPPFSLGSSPAPRGRSRNGPRERPRSFRQSRGSKSSYSGAPLAADQSEQARVVLGAGRTTVEMGSQPGNRRVRVDAGKLRLDVAVELLKALLAGELRATGSEQTS